MDSIEKLLIAADHKLDEGRLVEASSLFAQVCALDDRCARAFLMLGSIKAEQGDIDPAIPYVEKAITLDENYAEAYLTLGILYQHKGWADKAFEALLDAVNVEPDYLEVWAAIGSLSAGRYNDRPPVVTEMGSRAQVTRLLWRHGELDKAIALYRAILRAEPDNIVANLDLGVLCGQQRRWEEAQFHFDHVLNLEPDNTEALMNRGRLEIHKGDMTKACVAFKAVMDVVDAGISPDERLEALRNKANCSYVFCLNYVTGIDPAQVTKEHVAWADRYGAAHIDLQCIDPEKSRRKLRVAYVSPNFCRHSVAFFMERIMNNHDKNAFDIICYSDVKAPNQVTAQFEKLSTLWRNAQGISDKDLLELIRSDHVDILVDLAGHSDGNRLPVFAQRAAPLQITYLGYPNTTGLANMDYRITDAVADPVGNDDLYRERLYRLPGGFLCYAPYPDCPEVVDPPSIENGYITFGSMNTIGKLNDEVISVWAAILRKVPGSKLILKNMGLNNEQVRRRIIAAFAAHDIATDRLELIAWLPEYQDHFRLYGRIDITLDTFPYNGTTTTCEALWMGVPVVVMAQRHHAGRVGASIMHLIGSSDPIAGTLDEYIDNAVALANDTSRLLTMRKNLRSILSSSALCDGQRFTRNLESAYRAMWEAKYSI